MSGPDQWDMEQPWPPPGPWSFPRTGGETEEESDLDVSPSSSHYSPVADGGAQVRAACVLPGGGGWERSAATAGSLMPSHSSCSIFRERGGDHARIPDLHVHAHLSLHPGWLPLTFARGSSSSSLLSAWSFGDRSSCITLTLCPLLRAFIRAFITSSGHFVHS